MNLALLRPSVPFRKHHLDVVIILGSIFNGETWVDGLCESANLLSRLWVGGAGRDGAFEQCWSKDRQ